jgi:hypothetical protein
MQRAASFGAPGGIEALTARLEAYDETIPLEGARP